LNRTARSSRFCCTCTPRTRQKLETFATTKPKPKPKTLKRRKERDSFPTPKVACGASTRDALVRTAVGILDRFASRIESAETKPTCDSAVTPFASAFAPLASDALRALARLDDDAFRAALFFPRELHGRFRFERECFAARRRFWEGRDAKRNAARFDGVRRLDASDVLRVDAASDAFGAERRLPTARRTAPIARAPA
jgi:hypothetical protein